MQTSGVGVGVVVKHWSGANLDLLKNWHFCAALGNVGQPIYSEKCFVGQSGM